MTRQLTTDERGVSEVIGAILVFGLLISLVALMQTYAIPSANQEVEFNHNLEVQGDLVDFHQRVTTVALQGSGESVSVQAGTSYPSRLLFFNPPNPTGTLQTSERRNAEIQNIEATEPEVEDYLGGSTLQLDSRSFEYNVNYNEYRNPPTTRYEYGVLYNVHQNATLNQNPGSVIDDRNINLVFMAGNYSETSSQAQSLDVRPVSAPARPVTVTGQGGNNITLVLPTQMNVSEWEDLYEDQSTVLGITDGPSPDTVKINLNGTQTYTLRMARVGLERGVQKPDAHYIVPVGDGVSTIGAGDNATVKYEVRDEFNNPVSGANVTISGTRKQTDGNGRVKKKVSPGSPTTVRASIDGCTAGARCEADYRVEVTDLNPNPSGGVRLVDTSDSPVLLIFPTGDASMEFESTNGTKSIDKVRFNHYHPDPDAHSPVEMGTASGTITADIGGDFVDGSSLEDITTGGTTYDLTFDDTVSGGDFWIITLIFEDGDRGLYFASP